jgi:hypothetical protein
MTPALLSQLDRSPLEVRDRRSNRHAADHRQIYRETVVNPPLACPSFRCGGSRSAYSGVHVAFRSPNQVVRANDQYLSVAIDDFDFTADEVQSRLHAAFEAARGKDEFEFACTLLRMRGMEDAGWDPFVETYRLVEDLTALVAAPLAVHTKVRLGLLLYSHLTEVGAIYDLLANLMRVVRDERYSIDPFLAEAPRNRKDEVQFLSTPAKVRALQAALQADGHAEMSEVVDWFFNPSVRNAFAHADYILHQDKFRCRSESFERGGVQTPELPLEVLAELFNRSVCFYDAFMHEYEGQRKSYIANKIVLGRFAGDDRQEPVELQADPIRGLYGFRSPPGKPSS